MIRLVSPGRGGEPARVYELQVAPDFKRQAVALILRRSGGRERLDLIAEQDGALDLASELTGAVMRLRGQGDGT